MMEKCITLYLNIMVALEDLSKGKINRHGNKEEGNF